MTSRLPFALRNCVRTRSVCAVRLIQDSVVGKSTTRQFSSAVRHPTSRWFKVYDEKQRKEFWQRRREVGPEPIRHRDVWPNWNYDAEMFAFGQRLGEVTTSPAFRLAFTHESYTRQETERRKELQIEEPHQGGSGHQRELRNIGESVMTSYVPAICRYNMPFLPEEGIETLTNHLMQTKTLAHISRHLGTGDLIQCAEIPPFEETLSDTLLAVIGALAQEFGAARAQHFVLDFVVTSLLEVDVNELFQPKNPMGVVADIVRREGRAEPESRLLRECGAASPEAVYLIGVYSDKELIGQSFGETLLIAEEMAARDTLRRFFRTTINRRPLQFGKIAKSIDVRVWMEAPNVRLADWSEGECKNLLKSRSTGKSLLQEGPELRARLA